MRRLTTLVPTVLMVPAVFLAMALPFSPKGVAGIIVAVAGLIFFHELGHFLAAKWMGMPVETFCLGFGPRLIGFKWKETDVRLALLPLGGYVKLAGYNPEDPDAEDPHGFLLQPFHKRMLFYSGGILANMIVAFLLLWGLSADESRVLTWKTQSVQVTKVIKGGRAEAGGLKAGDELQQIGELHYPKATWEQTIAYIQARPEVPIPVKVQRKGQAIDLTLTPKNESGIGKLGMHPYLVEEVPETMRSMTLGDIGSGFVKAAQGLYYRTAAIVYGLWQLVSFQASVKDVGGPGAIGAMAYQAAKAGWRNLLAFMAFLSINLAVLNGLPIPFLDGGHMAILSFEKLRRKDLSIQLKEKILTAGLYFLLALMTFVIVLDIWRFRS